MKAITCSQCGALIGDISLEERFAKCNYCGAKLHPTSENIFDIPRKEAIETITEFEKTHTPIQPQQITKAQKRVFSGVIAFSILSLILLTVIAVFGVFAFQYFTPQITIEVGIEARADYVDSNIKSLNFDKTVYPEYSISNLPTWDEEELKKTVFKERKIDVKVKVDKEGKVFEADVLNGHEILQKICKKAALETTFFTPAPSELTITYLFYIKDVEWMQSED